MVSMGKKLSSWTDTIASVIGSLLPESKVKIFLKKYYNRGFSSFYALNKIISKVELVQDGILLVELNGMKFYGQQDKTSDYWINELNQHKLNKIKDYYQFVSLWSTLQKNFVAGLYEKHYKLKRGDIVIDAGAHIGTFSIKAAKIVGPEGLVIAIEPDSSNLSFLKRNLEENKLNNMVIIPKGIWSREDKLMLHLSSSTEGHGFYQGDAKENESTEVEVNTIDNMLREMGIKKVNFIKMNIEGAEVEALKGMDNTLGDNDVKVAIEAHHIVGGQKACEIVRPQLENMGFQVQAKWGGLILYGWKRRSII